MLIIQVWQVASSPTLGKAYIIFLYIINLVTWLNKRDVSQSGLIVSLYAIICDEQLFQGVTWSHWGHLLSNH